MSEPSAEAAAQTPSGQPAPVTQPGDRVNQTRKIVERHFRVDGRPRWDNIQLIFFLNLDPATVEDSFERLRRELKPLHLIPMLRTVRDATLLIVTPKPKLDYRSTKVNLVMLLLTILTTVWTGALFWANYTGEELGDLFLLEVFIRPRLLLMGTLTFALPLLTILGVHELGHYFTARRHGLEASLPFFIPMPPPFILGTMGAFISIREPIPNRKALLDIGVSGPIAGFLLALPITLIGLLLTEFYAAPVPEDTTSVYYLGSPLIFRGLDSLAQMLLPSTGDYLIHPVAFAGWAGFLVTALNLLPAGQLDGGHIARALLGEKAHYASLGSIGMMVFLGLFGLPGLGIPPYQGWLIFALLIMFLGLQHPPPLQDFSPVDNKRLVVGGFALFMLLSSFVAAPIIQGDSPFDFSLQAENKTAQLNETEFAAANYSVTFELTLNNTGQIWDNFTFELADDTPNWSVSFVGLNNSLLNQTQAEQLEYRLEEGEQLNFSLTLTREPTAVNDVEFSAWVMVSSVRGRHDEKLTVTVEIGAKADRESGG